MFAMSGTQVLKGHCHCGAVQFDVVLLNGFNNIRRCSCSLCETRGAVVVSAVKEQLTVTAGQEALTLYQFNTRVAKHYFCKHCGIYTHHQRRSNPEKISINVACLAGVSPFDFPEVPVLNGREHPRDADTPSGKGKVLGHLRFIETKE